MEKRDEMVGKGRERKGVTSGVCGVEGKRRGMNEVNSFLCKTSVEDSAEYNCKDDCLSVKESEIRRNSCVENDGCEEDDRRVE